MNLIGFDFSINKPAACIYTKNKYIFFSWPYDISEKIIDIYKSSGINIIDRTDDKIKGDNISSKMRYEVKNSKYLANLITSTLRPYLNKTTYLAFEGLSYGSGGDMGIQLGGYKYMLMQELSRLIALEKMYTYSPITVKSVAGCAKKGMNKSDMIQTFMNENIDSKFRLELLGNPEKFQTSKAKNWIVHLDDFVDAYYVLRTLQIKENLL